MELIITLSITILLGIWAIRREKKEQPRDRIGRWTKLSKVEFVRGPDRV